MLGLENAVGHNPSPEKGTERAATLKSLVQSETSVRLGRAGPLYSNSTLSSCPIRSRETTLQAGKEKPWRRGLLLAVLMAPLTYTVAPPLAPLPPMIRSKSWLSRPKASNALATGNRTQPTSTKKSCTDNTPVPKLATTTVCGVITKWCACTIPPIARKCSALVFPRPCGCMRSFCTTCSTTPWTRIDQSHASVSQGPGGVPLRFGQRRFLLRAPGWSQDSAHG